MTYDDYRYELPDFILGKSAPEVARAIERRIETDSTFRAEYLEMKSLIEAVVPSLNRSFEHAPDAPTPAYFESLSKKVLERTMPKRATWWQRVKADVASLFEVPRWQWAGGLVGASLALLLVIFAAELDHHMFQNKLAQYRDPQTSLMIATDGFARGLTPELIVSQIEAHEVEKVLNILESQLPTRKQTYKVLTEEEAESLFKPM